MVVKTYILTSLNRLNSQFRNAKSQQQSLYVSKLAIIELCGWIEVTMDEIALSLMRAQRVGIDNTTFIKKNVIKRNYGFSYDFNFKRMLASCVGMKFIDLIEDKCDAAKFLRMNTALEYLVTSRNAAAHTYIKGTTATLDAPSLTIAKFYEVYDGLVDFNSVARKIKAKYIRTK